MYKEPSKEHPHRKFWEHIKAGGRILRVDPLNGAREWLDLQRIGGDANTIVRYGYNDLTIEDDGNAGQGEGQVHARSRYIHGGWSHVFHPVASATVRICIDAEKEMLIAMERHTSSGWVPASRKEMDDVEDSLRQSNSGVFTSPEDWGLQQSDVAPDWCFLGAPSALREDAHQTVPAHGAFTAIQRTVLKFYEDGEHLGLQSMPEVEQCGDTLLLFLMRELASSEGCDGFEEALARLSLAQKQIDAVKFGLELVATPDA